MTTRTQSIILAYCFLVHYLFTILAYVYQCTLFKFIFSYIKVLFVYNEISQLMLWYAANETQDFKISREYTANICKLRQNLKSMQISCGVFAAVCDFTNPRKYIFIVFFLKCFEISIYVPEVNGLQAFWKFSQIYNSIVNNL